MYIYIYMKNKKVFIFAQKLAQEAVIFVSVVSNVVNSALADASSSAWEFSLTFNSSSLLANPR